MCDGIDPATPRSASGFTHGVGRRRRGATSRIGDGRHARQPRDDLLRHAASATACVVADFAVRGQAAEARASARPRRRGELPGLVRRRRAARSAATRCSWPARPSARGCIVGDNAGVRERCTHRRRRRRRPRGHRRERHHHRRAHEDPVRRLRHRVRVIEDDVLHRADGRHHERQLHGPHRGALQAAARAARSAAARASAAASHILPGVEIGEEAFVATGSVVTRDVPAAHARHGRARASVVREVPDEELLENQ